MHNFQDFLLNTNIFVEDAPQIKQIFLPYWPKFDEKFGLSKFDPEKYVNSEVQLHGGQFSFTK